MLAAAVAAISVPSGDVRTARMVNADYPAAAEQAGEEGVVLQRVVVGPNGRAERCEAVTTIGNPLFGEASCKSFRRWRMASPLGADGAPIHAVIHPVVGFILEPRRLFGSVQRPDDLLLKVRGTPGPARFSIAIQAGADGRVQHCRPAGEVAGALAAAACQVAGAHQWDVVEDDTGTAVPYVRHVSVGVEPDGGGPLAPERLPAPVVFTPGS